MHNLKQSHNNTPVLHRNNFYNWSAWNNNHNKTLHNNIWFISKQADFISMEFIEKHYTSSPQTPPPDIQILEDNNIPQIEISEEQNPPKLEVEPLNAEGKPLKTSSRYILNFLHNNYYFRSTDKRPPHWSEISRKSWNPDLSRTCSKTFPDWR